MWAKNAITATDPQAFCNIHQSQIRWVLQIPLFQTLVVYFFCFFVTMKAYKMEASVTVVLHFNVIAFEEISMNSVWCFHCLQFLLMNLISVSFLCKSDGLLFMFSYFFLPLSYDFLWENINKNSFCSQMICICVLSD